jgi:glycosyltransferase involved in cell wall biosynthesis
MNNINKKSIVVITTSFRGGGAQKIAVNLANHYSAKHKVELIAFMPEGPYYIDIITGVKKTFLNVRTRNSLIKLFYVLKKTKPDYILSVTRDSNIIVGLIALLFKSKIIFREANVLDGTLSMSFVKKNIFLNLMRFTYQFADKVIANSPDTKKDLLKYNIVKESKCKVIPNPVIPDNVNFLMNKKVSHEWFDDPNIKTIINVGRLSQQKNQKLLINAFEKSLKINNSLRLIIIGVGKEYKNLINLVKALEIDEYVQILDFKQNIYPYYKNSDLFVLSSLYEGFGNVIVEAMASAIPVICTDCSGGPSFILRNGKFGDLIPLDDPKTLSNLIIKRINNVDHKIISLARKRAFEFSISNISEEYLKF